MDNIISLVFHYNSSSQDIGVGNAGDSGGSNINDDYITTRNPPKIPSTPPPRSRSKFTIMITVMCDNDEKDKDEDEDEDEAGAEEGEYE